MPGKLGENKDQGQELQGENHIAYNPSVHSITPSLLSVGSLWASVGLCGVSLRVYEVSVGSLWSLWGLWGVCGESVGGLCLCGICLGSL